MTKLAQTPPERITEVKEFLRETKNIHERERARAILKLIEGKSRKVVADFFDINVATLDEWGRKFKKQGIAGLKIKPQPGNHHLLKRREKREIKTILLKEKKTPQDFGLNGKFWNVSTLKQFVRKKYGVSYRSDVSYQRLFAFCGFTHHKPIKVNKKQNPHMRRRFEDILKKRSNGTVEKMVWYW